MTEAHRSADDEVSSIRARHKSAKPKPQENPAWFHAEQDIARLLIVVDALKRDAARYRALRRNTGRETDISSGPGSPKLLIIRVDCDGCEQWLESGAPNFPATLDAALDDEIKRMGYDR